MIKEEEYSEWEGNVVYELEKLMKDNNFRCSRNS